MMTPTCGNSHCLDDLFDEYRGRGQARLLEAKEQAVRKRGKLPLLTREMILNRCPLNLGGHLVGS